MTYVTHIAAEPTGTGQVCARCGFLLIDALPWIEGHVVEFCQPDDPHPKGQPLWWPIGESIRVSQPHQTYSGVTEGPPTCVAEGTREGKSGG